jgi:hypothetical protein
MMMQHSWKYGSAAIDSGNEALSKAVYLSALFETRIVVCYDFRYQVAWRCRRLNSQILPRAGFSLARTATLA